MLGRGEDGIAGRGEIGRAVAGTVDGRRGTTASTTRAADRRHRLVMRRQVHGAAAGLGDHCHDVAATRTRLQLRRTAMHITAHTSGANTASDSAVTPDYAHVMSASTVLDCVGHCKT